MVLSSRLGSCLLKYVFGLKARFVLGLQDRLNILKSVITVQQEREVFPKRDLIARRQIPEMIYGF
jgi:hypothetical protein